MGHRKKLKIVTLDLGDKYEDLVVRMKSPSLGRLRKLMSTIGKEELDSELIDGIISLISNHLISWTLEDEEGVPLEPSVDEISDLDLPMLLDIANAWVGNVTNVDDDLGKGSPSGDQFPGQPVTMEAL